MEASAEDIIQLLKNDDTEELYKIFIKYASHSYKICGNVDYFKIYNAVKNIDNPNINYIMGEFCHGDIVVDRNFAKAKEYYQKSADCNNMFGQYRLGHIYEYGKGVIKNYEKAFEYYQKAADQGHPKSIYQLIYEYCRKRNYEKALEYLLKYIKIADQYNAGMPSHLMYIIRDNFLLYMIHSIQKKEQIIEKQFLKIKELEEENNELRYKPGNPGYQEAKEEFERLKS